MAQWQSSCERLRAKQKDWWGFFPCGGSPELISMQHCDIGPGSGNVLWSRTFRWPLTLLMKDVHSSWEEAPSWLHQALPAKVCKHFLGVGLVLDCWSHRLDLDNIMGWQRETTHAVIICCCPPKVHLPWKCKYLADLTLELRCHTLDQPGTTPCWSNSLY